jgi:D-sedoheptulose 7-phosphate isomerase
MNLNLFKKMVNDIDHKKINELSKLLESFEKVIIIGNGGSNAIASHIAVDYTKFLKRKCVAFTDASMLTCFVNDEGNENAFKEYLINFADRLTLVILISSSGNSDNIVNAAQYCCDSHVPFVTLTGFSPDNKVRTRFKNESFLDIWVNSESYAIVECMHMIYLHAVVDV